MSWTFDISNEELAVILEAGFIYRDAGRYDHARDIFQGVRALAPGSEVPEVGLGTLAFQQGEFGQAARHYHRALERNPQSAWAHAHLGELALFSKDKEKARDHLRTALELDPAGEFGRMARDLLRLAETVTFR
ncbi:MAG: tetratricopeptide repeat protein [Bryobacterales bacterium]|nr:tetratricopeptide repeat protein [Bryobacterales bacterium]